MNKALVLPGRSCLTCKYWERPNRPGDLGDCHRFPPVFQMFPAQGPGGQVAFQNVVGWTQTSEVDWCGEHKLKIDA